LTISVRERCKFKDLKNCKIRGRKRKGEKEEKRERGERKRENNSD